MQEGQKHPGGRPRRNVDAEQVKAMRAAGFSFRQIARQLRLGYGTIRRAAQARSSSPELSQN